MTEHSNKIADDEIDLKSLGWSLRAIVMYPFGLLFANIKTTLLFFITGVLLSFGLKIFLVKTYSASFIIRPNERNERVHVRMLADIQQLLKLSDNKGLAQQLNIDANVAAALADMKVSNFAFAKERSDSSNISIVTLELRDYTQAQALQTAILNYLENNPYFAKIREYQAMNIELKSKLIEKDILLLDSLKQLQLSSYNKLKLNDQSGLLLKDLVNPTATYTLSLERINQKAGLTGQRMFLNNFQLVKGVVVSEKATWPPRLLILLALCVPAFMVLCIIFLHFKTNRRA